MKIAIIGAGNIGTALGKKWMAAGHDVVFGVRNTGANNKAEGKAQMRLASVSDAAVVSDVILLATPAQAVTDVISQIGDAAGKIIIDATNTMRQQADGYRTAFDALIALTKAEVVKCFNTTGFENMDNTVYHGKAIDMFMAGDSTAAKSVAKELALQTGFGDCINFGGAGEVYLLEQLAICWINLAIRQGMGRNIALTIVRR